MKQSLLELITKNERKQTPIYNPSKYKWIKKKLSQRMSKLEPLMSFWEMMGWIHHTLPFPQHTLPLLKKWFWSSGDPSWEIFYLTGGGCIEEAELNDIAAFPVLLMKSVLCQVSSANRKKKGKCCPISPPLLTTGPCVMYHSICGGPLTSNH